MVRKHDFWSQIASEYRSAICQLGDLRQVIYSLVSLVFLICEMVIKCCEDQKLTLCMCKHLDLHVGL